MRQTGAVARSQQTMQDQEHRLSQKLGMAWKSTEIVRSLRVDPALLDSSEYPSGTPWTRTTEMSAPRRAVVGIAWVRWKSSHRFRATRQDRLYQI